MMNFELLPNEVLLELFDYFDGINLFCAFYGLNSRFNFLLYKQFRTYRFEFNSVSKRNFDMICQQHLPFISDRVISLSLSDNKETPEQINLFITRIPTFSQFNKLQSLSIAEVYSYKTLMKILYECHHLCSLTHLKFRSCHTRGSQTDYQLIVNNIWSLPKLIYCKVDIAADHGQELFRTPTKISSSLKCLFMYNSELEWNQIYQLFEYSPHLTRLSVCIQFDEDDNFKPFSLPMLIDLKIDIVYMSNTLQMISFLKNTPNLRRLGIHLMCNSIDGQQWEEIICNYLPKLQVFKLCMESAIEYEQDMQECADNLIDSFRNSFWVNDHQWFVRCVTGNGIIYLYTSSEVLYYSDEKPPNSWRSTYPHDDQQEFYNNMTSLHADIFFTETVPSCIRLPNIQHLSVKLPINYQFWSIIPSLNRLNSLRVWPLADDFQSQLQALLDRAPRVKHLYIHPTKSLLLQMSLLKCTSASIRELDLCTCYLFYSEEQCVALIRLPLGIQCEVLSILVNNRESIIILVENMINLRALTVQCNDDKYSKSIAVTENDDKCTEENIPNNDELVQWLKDRLSSMCMIVRNVDFTDEILIWI